MIPNTCNSPFSRFSQPGQKDAHQAILRVINISLVLIHPDPLLNSGSGLLWFMGCPIHFLIFYTGCTQCQLMLRSWVPTKPDEVHWPLLPAAVGWQPENHGAFSYWSPSITPFLGLIQVQCMCLRTKQNKTQFRLKFRLKFRQPALPR